MSPALHRMAQNMYAGMAASAKLLCDETPRKTPPNLK